MSFRRTQRNFWRLLWEGRTVAIPAALGVYTVSGAVFALFVLPFYVKIIVIIGPATIAVAAGVWWAAHQSLPPLFCDELSGEKRYSCEPCTQANLKTACELVRPIFRGDHVDWTILEQWRTKNPNAFMQLVNEERVLVACFVILGLQESFFDQLIAGTVTEGEITGEVVLKMRDTKKATRIYISGVCVRDPYSYLGSKRARVMLWCMSKYLLHHFGMERELFAVALNTQSQKLLKALGFSIATSANGRKDHHDFYHLALDKANATEIQMRVGDLSPCCSMKYA